ncbi:SBBP repeat-containing protein [Bacteroidota bacterium]
MKPYPVRNWQSALCSSKPSSNIPFTLLFVIIILCIFPSYSLFSQVDSTFEALQRSMNQQFEAYVSQNEQEFNQYREEIDQEFASYLKQAWEEFALFAAIEPDKTPKPKELPTFEPTVQKIPPRELLLEPAVGPPAEIAPVPNLPVILKPAIEEIEMESLSIDFYGSNIRFEYDPELSFKFPSSFTNQQIGDFWESTSQTDYAPLVSQLSTAKNSMNLNDWGFYLLVNQVAGKISNSTNTSRLLAWYLLTKSGYKIRVAYADNKIYLLFPASTMIYGIKYFLIDNVKYYAPDFPNNKVATYEKDFPEATQILDLNIYNALNIGTDYADRSFSITYENKDCSFTVKYNLNAVEFYKDYPLCELKVYFDAAVSPELKESLLNGLQPFLDGKSESSAVNFLLNFVQNGFEYKTDPEQFHGMEKFFFPEEDFYYPYSDCDDRAVLFAYLVKEMLGLQVVGVEYPGHIATAVHFNSDVPGDYILWQNEKYVIADPTYIDAPVGMTMPGMINEKARIIDLVNQQNTTLQYADIWEQAEKCGGKPGDNQQNIVTDADGNSYVTGYFSGEAQFGNTTLSSIKGQNDVFIAAFNNAGMPLWARQAGGDRSDLGYNIAMDKEGNLYVTGSFHGTIKFGDQRVKAPVYTDLYMAKYSPGGQLLWVDQAELDTTSETSDYIFVTSFTPKGKHRYTKLYPEDENFTNYGISFDDDENIYYTASYTSTVGLNMDMIWLDAEAEFNILTTLKTETDKQLSTNCEKTISGLFAAISLIRLDDISLSGETVQTAFQTYNPQFRQIAPKLYATLGKVDFVKNNEGIVTVNTEGEESVILDKLKIYHNARLKVIVLPSGDAKLIVLEGVKVGKAFIWFPLNYMKLFRLDGNVLFDYDDDHSQKMLNMKEDMLF